MARVLVIDDDPGIRDVCREILEQAGYSVDVAPDGAVGLKMFASAPYQVVLCDIFMPNMDGIETISELVRTYVAVTVVAMSGGAVGLPDYLVAKPSSPGIMASSTTTSGAHSASS